MLILNRPEAKCGRPAQNWKHISCACLGINYIYVPALIRVSDWLTKLKLSLVKKEGTVQERKPKGQEMNMNMSEKIDSILVQWYGHAANCTYKNYGVWCCSVKPIQNPIWKTMNFKSGPAKIKFVFFFILENNMIHSSDLILC